MALRDWLRYHLDKHALHITAGTLAVCVVAWSTWVILSPTSTLETPQRIHISSGESLYSIAHLLKDKGMIRSSTVFIGYVSALGREKNLKAGDYLVPAGSNLNDIAFQISQGRALPTDIAIFIPEGYNIWEIDQRLTDQHLLKAEGDFANEYKNREGYLFPDTYRFDPKNLLGEIEQKMESNGKDKMQQLLGNLTLTSQDRILTIASIIEKEARSENDMALVSGVIANRLKRHMPLAIDATVAYGACMRQFNSDPSKDCRVQDVPIGAEVKVDSPYNTYTRAGLPAGPISNPGLASIEAALNPKGDYLYYLSTRDGSRMIFSHTAAEHEANRKKYLGL